MRIAVTACLLALGITAAAPAAANYKRPTAPVVRGARFISTPVVHLRFQARERGVAARRIRFRCALDGGRLKSCPASFTARLAVGAHSLRVRAVDPRGRTGPITRVRITVQPSGPSVKSIPVSGSPVNLVFAQDAVWASSSDGSVSRIEPATNKVAARIAVGTGQLGGVAFGDGSLWVANFEGGELDRVDPGSGSVVARIAVGGQPVGPAVAGDGTVWVFELRRLRRADRPGQEHRQRADRRRRQGRGDGDRLRARLEHEQRRDDRDDRPWHEPGRRPADRGRSGRRRDRAGGGRRLGLHVLRGHGRVRRLGE